MTADIIKTAKPTSYSVRHDEVRLIVHELGHLAGMRTAMLPAQNHQSAVYSVSMDTGGGMMSYCSAYDKFSRTQRWLSTVGGMITGAAFLAEIFGNYPQKEWRCLPAACLLAYGCRGKCTSLQDVFRSYDVAIKEEAHLPIFQYFWLCGLHMAQGEKLLSELERLDQTVRSVGRMDLAHADLCAFLPNKLE